MKNINQIENVQLPPASLEVEQAVLGAMLLDAEAIVLAVESVKRNYFYKKAHQVLFSSIVELYNNNVEVDLLTLSEYLKDQKKSDQVGGPYYLAELSNSTPSSANIINHLKIIKQKALSRFLLQQCNSISMMIYEQQQDIESILDYSENAMHELAAKNLPSHFVEIKDSLIETFQRIEANSGNQSGITGIASGYKKIDELTAGFQPGELIVLAGRPSMGKTAFVLNLARNAAIDTNESVGIFSLEMAVNALTTRLLCAEARVNMMAIRSNKLSREETERLVRFAGRLSEAPIFIDDSSSLNILELRAKARRLYTEQNIGLLIIDYLTLIDGVNMENRYQEIGQISRGLKGLAKELNIPVIALSQLSRAVEQRDKTKRPQLSDLRESGAIEQDADVVMFVYRPEYYGIMEYEDTGQSTHNMCEIIIGKQRNGPVGNVRLVFLKEFGKFAEPDTFSGSGIGASSF